MLKQKVFTATEARQNFFEILKLVESGTDAVIEKRDASKRYIITIEVPPKKENAQELMEKWDKINLNLGLDWKEIKKIISTRHDLR